MIRQSSLPGSRFKRLLHMGRLATGVATTVAGEGLKRMSRGEKTTARELLLTPGNAAKIAERLSEMRGAAMKIGQLLSMDSGSILPREVADQLSRLRDDAHAMTATQLAAVLQSELGPQWRQHFASFNEMPSAAASIGQVHEARAPDGGKLAVKVQYPGVDQSIDSDVDNAMAIIRLFKLLPSGMDIGELVATAKNQLHDEADYRTEAQYLQTYQKSFPDDLSSRFSLPRLVPELSSRRVMTMSYVDGENIEALAQHGSQHERDRVAGLLIHLSLHEALVSGVVQTDPNFSNFRYHRDSGRIGLVDFGAVRILPPERCQALRKLIQALRQANLSSMAEAAAVVGYFNAQDDFNYRMAVIDLLTTAAEPLHQTGRYNFGSSGIAGQLGQKLVILRSKPAYQRLPATDIFYLHRKLAGLFMLISQLRARVEIDPIIERVLVAGEKFPTGAAR